MESIPTGVFETFSNQTYLRSKAQKKGYTLNNIFEQEVLK